METAGFEFFATEAFVIELLVVLAAASAACRLLVTLEAVVDFVATQGFPPVEISGLPVRCCCALEELDLAFSDAFRFRGGER